MTAWACVAVLGGLFGCDSPVATLPQERAQHVMRAMAQMQIPAETHRAGGNVAIHVEPTDRKFAHAVILAVDRPTRSRPEPRLIHGPTDAKIEARNDARHRLERAILAMHGVLAVEVTMVDGVRVAVVTAGLEPDALKGRVQAMLGPASRVVIERIQRAPAGPARVSSGSPVVLSAVVGVLILMILGLLGQIRRLRRSLGQ